MQEDEIDDSSELISEGNSSDKARLITTTKKDAKKKSKLDRMQDEIRSSQPHSASVIVHETDHEIVIRRPMTYGSINSPDNLATSLSSTGSVTSLSGSRSGNEATRGGTEVLAATHDPRLVKSRYRYYGRLDAREQSSLMMPAHVLLPECYTYVTIEDTESKKQSSIITIFSIWNTMMGTSMLSMPWGIDRAGFACGIVLLVVIAALCLYSAYLIIRSQKNIGLPGSLDMDFTDICRHYLGRFGEYSSIILSLLSLLCAAVVYWILMSNFLYNSVDFVYEKSNHRFNKTRPSTLNNDTFDDDVVCILPHVNTTSTSFLLGGFYESNEAEISSRGSVERLKSYDENFGEANDPLYRKIWNLHLTVPLFLLVILFPLINIKSPKFFMRFTAMGTISVVFLLTFVTVKAARWGFHLNFEASGILTPVLLFKWSFPALSGMLSLAYFIHNCILSILRNQKHLENNARDLSIAYICVAATLTFVGVVFYSSFPLSKNCLSDNLLNNFVPDDGWAFGARIFLFIQMLTVFPLLAYIFRVQLLKPIFNSIYPGRLHVFIFNASLVGVCVIVAIFFPQIGNIIRYCGSICGLGYIFTLPAVILMLQLKENNQLNPIIVVIHVFIMVLGAANCISQFII